MALKKLAIILLMGLYGLSALGMSVKLHYCCGKIAGISLSLEKSRTASCKHGSKMSMPGCCSDQQVTIDVDDSQGLSSSITIPALPTFHLPEHATPLAAAIETTTTATVANIRGSPPALAVPIYLFNQVFRN